MTDAGAEWQPVPKFTFVTEYRSIDDEIYEVRNSEYVMRIPKEAFHLWRTDPLGFANWLADGGRNKVLIWLRD